MLLVQEFLKTKTFGDLEREHAVYASFDRRNGHKFSLNYDQIGASESDKLSQQCRGLILTTGQSLLSQAKIVNERHDFSDVCPGETRILAYSFNRFFNYGQGAAHIDWNDPQLKTFEKLDGCFDYDSMLQCWDGSFVRIGEAVKKKLKLQLIGLNKRGEIVPCEITNWFNNGKKNHWVEFTLASKFKGKNRKFKSTINHSILVDGEYKIASDIKAGDNLTSYKEFFNDDAIHVIESALLGDGSISKNGPNYRFEESHKFAHGEYVRYIHHWLGFCGGEIRSYKSGFGSDMRRVSSSTNPSVTLLRKKWYPNGKKVVPKNLDWMDDFSVAKWYMDDGALAHHKEQSDRANFATNGFSKRDVNRLASRLRKMYGVSCTVYNSKGWCLRVNAGRDASINKMWEAIAPHIVECMRYKIPERYRNVKYKHRNNIGKLIRKTVNDKVLSVKTISVPPTKSIDKDFRNIFPHGRVGYDIETTTHNYVVNNHFVHNSLCIVYFDNIIHEWHVATRSVPEADVPFVGSFVGSDNTFRKLFERGLHNVGNVSFKDFCKELDPEKTYCYELTSPYNRVVVNYQDTRITLLAARHNITHQEILLEETGLCKYVPVVKSYDLGTIEKTIKFVNSRSPMNHEGLVIRDSKFNRIKVKNASYVAYSKARDSLASSPRACLEIVLNEKDDDVIPFMPDEIVTVLREIKEKTAIVLSDFDIKFAQVKSRMNERRANDESVAGWNDRKLFAVCVQESGIWQAPCFQIYQGRCSNIREYISSRRQIDGQFTNSFLDEVLRLIKFQQNC